MKKAKSRKIPLGSSLCAFERECVAFFADIVHLFGIPRSAGQIYELLFSVPEPLGFADIVERLGVSKGSASQGLKLLRSLGAITEAAPREGTTGSVYNAELSLRQLVAGVLDGQIAPIATSGKERLDRLKRLAIKDLQHAKFYSERAAQLEKWRHRFTVVLPILATLLGPKKKAK